jgi:hydrogenase maturation protease
VNGVRILGIGSPSGDDQAGWLTVDALLAGDVHTTAEGILIEKLDRPGTHLISLLDDAAWVILIDAMHSHDAIGRIRRFGVEDWPAYRHGLSSHGFGVLDALALARELGSLPHRLDLYGIEIGSANPGEPAGNEIHAAAQQLARHIAAGLTASLAQARSGHPTPSRRLAIE